MSDEAKLEVIHSFLSSEFADFAMSRREEADRYRYELRKDNQRHVIVVSREFLDAFSAEEIGMQLLNYNVVMITRSLGDLPILVTTNGCIFDRDIL